MSAQEIDAGGELTVTCRTCGEPYENRAPLLVKGEVDGKRTWVPPAPSADWWYPACRCRPVDPLIIHDGKEIARA